jgi:polysaccharide pyruvyl transferase WcaK-like protein
MHRRLLLAQLATALAVRGAQKRPPRLLLRSAWQTVNIGDIAHTPGLLALLERHLPEAEVWLWPSSVDSGVDDRLRARFPQLRILAPAEVAAALPECDFLLHGSGPSLVAERDVRRWVEETGKPFGVFGITLAPPGPATVALLNRARFVFCRDSVSLQAARTAGITAPTLAFGPDAAFATDLRDDAAAEAFLARHGLAAGKFLCCIPRLRFTPYWRIKPGVKIDPVKQARNAERAEADHAPLRAAIAAVVRASDWKILLCPEDRTQMEVGQAWILHRLPADVRERVVWRPDYWLTGEALSTYRRSGGLFGNEMHSPILCIGHGIPALVARWSEQTSKGFMWRDIGLGDWLFDHDDPDSIARLPQAVLSLVQDPARARARAELARDMVRERQRRMVETLAAALPR